MNIFDQLKDIISYKKNILSKDVDSEKDFTPYMVQRWLSFHSKEFANILNHSTNFLWQTIDEKQIWYKFFLGIIPKSKFKNIKYIKKVKENKQKDNTDIVDYLAYATELSKREIKEYINSPYVNDKMLKKQLQI